jgi:hypothetical protein
MLETNYFIQFYAQFSVAKFIGRRLYAWEMVRHLDGNFLNNKSDNVLICSKIDFEKLGELDSTPLPTYC